MRGNLDGVPRRRSIRTPSSSRGSPCLDGSMIQSRRLASPAIFFATAEDVTLALYLDDRHRVGGHAVVAIGRVQAARLSARPILLLGARACRTNGVRSRPLSPLGAGRRLTQLAMFLRSDRWRSWPPGPPPQRPRCGRRFRRLHLGISQEVSCFLVSLLTICGASCAAWPAWAPLPSTCLGSTDRASAPSCHRPWCRP